MNWGEFLSTPVIFGNKIEVTILSPVRKPLFKDDSVFTHGKLTGFKCGRWGGGHFDFKHGRFTSYDSSKTHWIRKPKVHVTYNAFEWGKKEYSDWIDVDNCDFKI